jgi:hypothetical protein
VPNLAAVFGYINASWTLKADLICHYVCRLLNLMDRKRARQVTPRSGHEAAAAPFIDNDKFNPGYMERAIAHWPKQGSHAPWRVYQNYLRDIWSLKFSPIANPALEFSNPVPTPSQQASPAPGHQLA